MPSFQEQMGKGRQRGAVNKLTAFRRSLMDLLPEARQQLADAVSSGDLKAISLIFESVLVPLRSDYPTVPIDLAKPPGHIAADIRTLLATGAIGIGHANAVADLALKLQRLETSQKLIDAEIVAATPLETATQIVTAAAGVGDLDTLETALTRALPYLEARPQPELPDATGKVSAEPHPDYGLSEDEKMLKWQEELDRYRE